MVSHSEGETISKNLLSTKWVVEVAYARPDVQVILPVQIEHAATVEEAIRRSGILESYPEIDLNVNKVSIFGKLTKLDNSLRPGDRVEINRPLLADPKQLRKQRAERDKTAQPSHPAAGSQAAEEGG
jgi:putative ubiquitin-RnfH superfamily antitoxin RatB of RatAB toxin-antitoxin module